MGQRQEIEGVVANLGGGLSGDLGDYLALLLAIICIISGLARALNVYPILANLPSAFIHVTPLSLSLSAIALWISGGQQSSLVYHHHLTMLPFLLALFLRFSGSCWEKELPHSFNTLVSRWISRAAHYSMLFVALALFSSTARLYYALPLLLLLSVGRSNEVFRAWTSASRNSRSEKEQFRIAVQTLSSKALMNNYEEPTLSERSRGKPNSAFQLGFLWVDGSGTLVTASLMLLLLTVVSIAHSSSSSSSWIGIIVQVVYFLAALYLIVQCLPGFFLHLDKIAQLLNRDSDTTFKSWVEEIRLWLLDVWSFLLTLAKPGTSPLMCSELHSVLAVPLCYLEGVELILYVFIASMARLLLHAIALSLASVVKSMKLGDPIAKQWQKIRHLLFQFASSLCAVEFQMLKNIFLEDQKLYILVGLKFQKMDTRSKQDIAEPGSYGIFAIPGNSPATRTMKTVQMTAGYCPIKTNEMKTRGYGYLWGTFVEEEAVASGSNADGIRAVVGGWVTSRPTHVQKKASTLTATITGEAEAEETVEEINKWGDCSERDEGNSEEVARFYGKAPYKQLFQGMEATELRVHVKWGPISVAPCITHLWQDNRLRLGTSDWAPSLTDSSRVAFLAKDVTSWPHQTAWALAFLSSAQSHPIPISVAAVP